MAGTVARTLLYALVAAASPMALTATLAVLHTRRPRMNGFVFAVAFLLGSLFIVILVLAVGAAGPSDDLKGTFGDALAFLLGIVLLAAAWRLRHGLPARRRNSSARTQAVLDALTRLNAAGAFSIGAALGIGGPKRLTLTVIAATTISAAGLSNSQDAVLSALYIVVASILVWVPVAAYLVAGRRANEWLEAGAGWLKAHQHAVTMVLLVVFGLALVGDGLAGLLQA
jgi:Sap-like sulfolipid-1-addressing protein